MAAEPRWTAGNHPEPEQLLLATEGQLASEKAEPVLDHIQQCWQCRSRVESFSRGIEAYLKFRETMLDPAAAPQPGGWLRLSSRLAAVTEPTAAAKKPFFARVPRGVWLAASLTAAGVIAAVLLYPEPVTAQSVLDRAVRADAGARMPAVQRVRVRRGGQILAQSDSVLNQARIDRARPLSVAPFREWHDSLKSREDSVAALADEIRVQTTTTEGLISLATLTLARATYEPHAKHVELRDGIVIDVDSAPAIPEAPVTESTAGVHEPHPAKAAIAAEERDALEVEVRWALRRIDADLGEPLEIQAAGDDLIISGTLDDAARRDQIAEALRGMARVSTRLQLAIPDTDLLAKSQPIDTGGDLPGPLLTSRLAADFPDTERRRAFVSQALHLARDIVRHSWALRRLAERYAPSSVAALPPEARASLLRLVAAHQSAIDAAAQQASTIWKPYAELDAHAVRARADWQTASRSALEAAQTFDHITARLLAAGGDDNLSSVEALLQLQENYRRLR
ncbi:MAG TPA: hypothetical protein VKU19_28640 [Bryobacteraceae bacterium]|nr:hypothetical protein [Bryobacteraceae bacterium]